MSKKSEGFKILGLTPFDAAVFLAWVLLSADSIYEERYYNAAGEFLIGGVYFFWRGLTRSDSKDKDDDDDDHGGIEKPIEARA